MVGCWGVFGVIAQTSSVFSLADPGRKNGTRGLPTSSFSCSVAASAAVAVGGELGSTTRCTASWK